MCEFHTFVKKRAAKNVIGPTIRKVRVSMNPKVSQQDLAGRLAARGIQIDRSVVARMEAGGRSVRDYEIIAVAAALRVPLIRLFEG
jgi:hypothetical protein